MEQSGQPMEQTMQASAPPQPQAPPVDQEIIEAAKAQAEQIVAEANQVLEQAQMQAQQMVQEAMAQAGQAAEEARQQAGQQGYEEGMQAGIQEGRQAGQVELQQLINTLKTQFIDLVKLRRKIMVDMEPEIVKLAWQVAKRVVGEELKSNREVIVGVVRSSLHTLQERDEILIRVNPQEYESVKAHQSELEAMIEGLKKFTIQPDGAIELGSCAIETNLGNVDARIETQFEAIRLGLEEMTRIRQFEMEDQLAGMPVEVPGDPDFEARMKEQQHAPPPEANQEQVHQEAPPHHHEQGHEAPQQEMSDEQHQDGEPEMTLEQMEQMLQEMEMLPDPTDELLATLTPEEQQQFLEAYQQQQEFVNYVQHRRMEAQAQEGEE